MFCRKCGKEIPDDSEFCYKCGVRVVSIDDNSERVVTPAPADNAAERAAENPKINLDKPETSQNQGQDLEKSSNTVDTTNTKQQTLQMPKNCPLCGKPVIRNRESCPYCGEEYTAVPANMNKTGNSRYGNSDCQRSGQEEKYGQFRKITLGIGWVFTVFWYLIVSEISGFGELMGYVGGGIGFIAFVSFLMSFSWGPAVIIVIRKIILCVVCVTKFEPEFRMEHEQISGIRYIVASILGFIITGPMCGGCRNDMEGAVSVALYLAIPLLAVGITSFICYGVLKKAAGKQK